MVHPKSLMTDRSWQLVTAIRATMAGTSSTAEIIEMALSAYVHQQSEYIGEQPIDAPEVSMFTASTAQPDADAAPSTDLVGD